jgi:hypothetical protein
MKLPLIEQTITLYHAKRVVAPNYIVGSACKTMVMRVFAISSRKMATPLFIGFVGVCDGQSEKSKRI